MNRYQFTEKSVEQAKKFIKTKSGVQPPFMKRFKGEIKKGNLYLDGKMVIPKEKVEEFLRKKMLSGRVPMSRDGLFYYLGRTTVGASRAAIEKFLKAQHILRDTDNAQPQTKNKTSRRVLKKGQLEYDLVEINWKDLKFRPTDKGIEKEAGYVFTCADQLTGLLWAKFGTNKNHSVITPLAEECFAWMADKLQTPLQKLFAKSDDGKEFDRPTYNKWGVRTKVVKRGNFIEMKNSQFQRQLYRIAKMQLGKKLAKLVKNAMDIVNRTQSSLIGVAPLEALDMPVAELVKRYNKNRGGPETGTTVVRARDLKPGDMVRVDLVGPKKTSFHKAYKDGNWSKVRYKVLQKRGNRYKIDYHSGKKFFHRDALRLTTKADNTTKKVLHARVKAERKAEQIESEKIRKKIAEKYNGSIDLLKGFRKLSILPGCNSSWYLFSFFKEILAYRDHPLQVSKCNSPASFKVQLLISSY